MLCWMLVCSILCLSIPSLSAQVPVERRNCTMPPYPKNGYYKNIDEHRDNFISYTDRKMTSYYMKMFCDDGYKGIGQDTMACFKDGRRIDTDFECIPYCEKDKKLVSCGDNSRCIVVAERPGPAAPRTPAGRALNYSECGTKHTEQRPRRQASPGTYVSGGRSARHSELPWHAGVYSKKTRPYMQICGGTLVSPSVVISAAHCFWSEVEKKLPAGEFAVAVGKLYRPWNEPRDLNSQKSDVAEIRIPPYFRGHATNLQDDIALLILASSFTFSQDVRPACLDFELEFDKEHLQPMTLGKVAGWGLTSQDGPPSPVLKVIEIPVVDLKDCQKQIDPSFRAHITSDKICAGWTNGTAVCKGDSGGGLFIPLIKAHQNTRMFLRGIVSGAPPTEHLCNVYTWATFTHVNKHERFIKETLQESAAMTT